QQPVDTRVTGFDISRTQREGYYVDTRDASGRTLARLPARGVFQPSAEAIPEHPRETITRVDAAQPRGRTTAIFPVPQPADHLSGVHVTAAQPNATLAAGRATSAPEGAPQEREIARFPLNLSR